MPLKDGTITIFEKSNKDSDFLVMNNFTDLIPHVTVTSEHKTYFDVYEERGNSL